MSATAMNQSKAIRQLCETCRERKARFEYRGHVKADRDHTLCFQCYRAEHDRRRATMLSGVKPAMLRAPFQQVLTTRELQHRRRMLHFAENQGRRATHR
jgi:hypothetical protein